MKTDHLTPEQIAQVIGPLLPYGFGTAVAQRLALAVLAAAPEPPIAMPTEEEATRARIAIENAWKGGGLVDAVAVSVLCDFVSRRNAPPEPSLREKCIKLARGNDVLSEQEAETLVDRFLAVVEEEKAK